MWPGTFICQTCQEHTVIFINVYLPRDRKIVVHCQSGQRSYNATRILSQNGFNAANLSGGYRTFGQTAAATPG
jgi:rhodanese-related sulfurtransferase